MTNKSRSVYLPLIIIFLIGLVLRFYRVGESSLWNDEAGQLLAALQPTFADMMEIIRSHAMAMPLDYLVTRIVSHFSISEGILRLPSVIWGTFTIPIIFLFARKLLCNLYSGNRSALFLSLLLAVSPIHIFYSQEMRFYSSLGFFYWLATYIMLLYIESPRMKLWIVMVLVLIIGELFHPFVLLSFVNGISMLIASVIFTRGIIPGWKESLRRQGLAFGIAGLLAGIAIGIYFIVLNPSSYYTYDLLWRTSSIGEFFLQAMGWKSLAFCVGTSTFSMWEMLLIFLSAVGLWSMSRRFPKSWIMVSLLVSLFFQIVIIVFLNITRGYFLVFRQAIHLAPILMIFAAIGMDHILAMVPSWESGSRRWVTVVSGICICLVALPSILQLSQVDKSNARHVVEAILTSGFEPRNVQVAPFYETKVYQVYFDYYYHVPGQFIIPAALDRLEESEKTDMANFLITPLNDIDDDSLLLRGYKPLLTPQIECDGSRAVLFREIPKPSSPP